MTREEWLNKMTDALRPLFLEAGGEIPENVRSTCGWPSQGAKAKKKLRVGECWGAESSDDKHFEIFLSPLLDDGNKVAGVLIHELCHATLGIDVGHKAPFRKLAMALGLEGSMPATTVGEDLQATLAVLVEEVGPYPHAKLVLKGKKTQTTRMHKIVCPDPACGYMVRTSQKWIDLGTPVCYCGTKMEVEEAHEKTAPEGGEEGTED